MLQAGKDRLYWTLRLIGLAVVLSTVVSGLGCGFVSSRSSNQSKGDPLHLGGSPGPDGTVTPQLIQVRLGSEPSDRIVSLSLTLNTLQATNSGSANIELLTPNPNPQPVTVEFTRSSTVSEPISIGNIYRDTYSALVFPAMTGQVVFYDSNGQLVTQPLTEVDLPAQTVAIAPFSLGTTPLVLSVSLDLSQTFTINDPARSRRLHAVTKPDSSSSYVSASPLVLTAQATPPVPAVAPAVGQPETGAISFLVGNVNSVDTNLQTISIQPTSGDLIQVSYDNTTQFIDGDPSVLTGMLIEADATTQSNGTVLASEVTLLGNGLSSTELYGLLSGYAPEGIYYNLIVNGGIGVNETTSLIGSNVTIDWNGASYSVNQSNLDLSGSSDLVFDETRVFPGQFVGVQGTPLVIPDPESDTQAGVMQPFMFELNQQTLTGLVSGYSFDPETQTGTFTFDVNVNSPIQTMNPGLISITVRQTPQTDLRNGPIQDNDIVKVRGLLFVDPAYNNTNYQPSPETPVAFIMVAGRISK